MSPPGVHARVYEGLGGLPHFNPDDDTDDLPGPVESLRGAIREADALLFSVPEYAGGLPGSLKNLLDWSIGDDHWGSIYEKPVAWINASQRGALHAHESLRRVLGYAHASIVEEACVDIPVTADIIGADGQVSDAGTRTAIGQVVARLAGCLAG